MSQLQALQDFEALHGRKMTRDEIEALAKTHLAEGADSKARELFAIVEERWP